MVRVYKAQCSSALVRSSTSRGSPHCHKQGSRDRVLAVWALFVCWTYTTVWSLITKQTRCTNFLNLFLKWNSTCFGQFFYPSSGIFSLYTQQWYISYKFDETGWKPVPSWSCSQAVSKPVWYIPLLCVQWKTPGDGQRNCPKHEEFHSENKFEKLVHLVDFTSIIRSTCDILIPTNCAHIIIYNKLLFVLIFLLYVSAQEGHLQGSFIYKGIYVWWNVVKDEQK